MKIVFYALGLLLAIALLLAGPLGRDFSPEVTAAAVREAGERKGDVRPCDALWIRQCAAGECWSPRPPAKECAPGADLTEPRDMPNHLMTIPIHQIGARG